MASDFRLRSVLCFLAIFFSCRHIQQSTFNQTSIQKKPKWCAKARRRWENWRLSSDAQFAPHSLDGCMGDVTLLRLLRFIFRFCRSFTSSLPFSRPLSFSLNFLLKNRTSHLFHQVKASSHSPGVARHSQCAEQSPFFRSGFKRWNVRL